MANTAPKSRSRTTQSASRSRAASASRARSAAKRTPPPPPSNGSNLRAPLMAGGAALAGMVGGVILGAKGRRRRHRLPSVNGLDLKKVDIRKTAKQFGRASKQFGELTKELRKAGEQAERIGNALS